MNAQNRAVERDCRFASLEVSGARWDNGGTAKRPLGGALTPLIQGASPTNEESTDD